MAAGAQAPQAVPAAFAAGPVAWKGCDGCKPDSVGSEEPDGHLSARLIPGRCPGPFGPERAGGPSSLFCLAPHGVCRAPSITLGAVGSYPAVSPFPDGFPPGGLLSATLSVTRSFRRRAPRLSPGMPPFGVRTFLPPGPCCHKPGERPSAITLPGCRIFA
jgi:hypothetical protein